MTRELSRSRELQRRAEHYLPGGVNSPVRAFRAVGGDPPFLVRGGQRDAAVQFLKTILARCDVPKAK